jgi:hypothetical protein
MRVVLAALVVLLAGSTFDSAKADPYRWCAVYGGNGDGDAGTNCGFITWGQCLASISGMGGFCQPNLFYDGRPVVTPEDRPVRRQRPRRR